MHTGTVGFVFSGINPAKDLMNLIGVMSQCSGATLVTFLAPAAIIQDILLMQKHLKKARKIAKAVLCSHNWNIWGKSGVKIVLMVILLLMMK